MATSTVMPLLYFTQNLVGESLPDWTGLKLDFDPPGIGLKADLPNRVAKGDLFLLGSEPRLFNPGGLWSKGKSGTDRGGIRDRRSFLGFVHAIRRAEPRARGLTAW